MFYSTLTFAQNKLIFEESGLNVLEGNNAFNFKSIKHLLPTYQVIKSIGYTENEPYPTIEVSLNNELLVTVNSAGNEIFSIISKSNKVASYTGHKIGDLFKNIYKNSKYDCNVGYEEWAGYAMCRAPESEHIYYVFEKTNMQDYELPTREQLNPVKIEAIFWSKG